MRDRVMVLIPVALCLFLWTSPGAFADVCDDIDDLAESWAVIADALEETAGEDVGDLDVPRLERDVNRLLAPTEALAQALIDLGNIDEEEMGGTLLGLVDNLADVTGDDMAAYLVDRIDDLTIALDDVIDYCDQVVE